MVPADPNIDKIHDQQAHESGAPPDELAATDDDCQPSVEDEIRQARALATRYRLEYVEMENFHIDQDLFRSIPAEVKF